MHTETPNLPFLAYDSPTCKVRNVETIDMLCISGGLIDEIATSLEGSTIEEVEASTWVTL